MKMWVAKTVHLLEWVRNLGRYKRPILASLMSAVLIISIIFVVSFLPTARSGSGDGYSYFEITNGFVDMFNVSMKGPVTYNGLQVTNVTADWANITARKYDWANLTGMLLVRHLPDGRNLTMRVENAIATKLTVYTTFIGWADAAYYGYSKIPPALEFISRLRHANMRMEAVYVHAESFSASWLNLTLE